MEPTTEKDMRVPPAPMRLSHMFELGAALGAAVVWWLWEAGLLTEGEAGVTLLAVVASLWCALVWNVAREAVEARRGDAGE